MDCRGLEFTEFKADVCHHHFFFFLCDHNPVHDPDLLRLDLLYANIG